MTEKAGAGESKAGGWGVGGEPVLDALAAEGRENFESFVKASAAAAKGSIALRDAWFAYAGRSIDANVEAARAVLGANSLADAAEAQADHAKASVERSLAEGTRIAELAMKTANDTMAPLRARVESALERGAPRA